MKFIIYAPSYNENNGGILVLHQLCHELNLLGEKAYLWPRGKASLSWSNIFKSMYYMIKYSFIFNFKYDETYEVNASWVTPMGGFLDLYNAIVIYPEIISGNPLQAKRVVRWFLNKPNVLKQPIAYQEGELYFFYAKVFNDEEVNPYIDNQLTVINFLDTIYKKTNSSKRKGTAYMMRKYQGKMIVHDSTNSICLDNLSHQEIAKVFNSVERFISYDLYTMYSQYAVLSGCLSIVVPDDDVSNEIWRNSHGSKKYGIAYGFSDDEITFAKSTQDKILIEVKEVKDEQKLMLNKFIEKCYYHFYGKK